MRLLTLICCLTALVVGFASTADATHGSVPARTRVAIYAPFTPDGNLARGITVVQRVRGSCWTGSEGDIRSDAWRCIVGDEILDPCFSGAAGWVACPTLTSQYKIIRLNLTKPLPMRFADPPLNTNKSLPTTVTLARNVSCGFSGGATSTVAGLRLNYYCTNHAWLLGAPNRSSPLWTILYLPSRHATQATSVTIYTARW